MERRFRLRGESEVREARSRGKAYADGPLVARICGNSLDPVQNRYAVVAGKRVGNAVHRNRAKRLVREALRALHPRVRPGHDMVVIIRGTTDELSGFEIALASMTKIFSKANIFERNAPNQTGATAATVDASNGAPSPADGEA